MDTEFWTFIERLAPLSTEQRERCMGELRDSLIAAYEARTEPSRSELKGKYCYSWHPDDISLEEYCESYYDALAQIDAGATAWRAADQALLEAILAGRTDAIAPALANGASLNPVHWMYSAKRPQPSDPVTAAILCGNIPALHELLRLGARLDVHPRRHLIFALAEQPSLVPTLIAMGLPVLDGDEFEQGFMAGSGAIELAAGWELWDALPHLLHGGADLFLKRGGRFGQLPMDLLGACRVMALDWHGFIGSETARSALRAALCIVRDQGPFLDMLFGMADGSVLHPCAAVREERRQPNESGASESAKSVPNCISWWQLAPSIKLQSVLHVAKIWQVFEFYFPDLPVGQGSAAHLLWSNDVKLLSASPDGTLGEYVDALERSRAFRLRDIAQEVVRSLIFPAYVKTMQDSATIRKTSLQSAEAMSAQILPLVIAWLAADKTTLDLVRLACSSPTLDGYYVPLDCISLRFQGELEPLMQPWCKGTFTIAAVPSIMDLVRMDPGSVSSAPDGYSQKCLTGRTRFLKILDGDRAIATLDVDPDPDGTLTSPFTEDRFSATLVPLDGKSSIGTFYNFQYAFAAWEECAKHIRDGQVALSPRYGETAESQQARAQSGVCELECWMGIRIGADLTNLWSHWRHFAVNAWTGKESVGHRVYLVPPDSWSADGQFLMPDPIRRLLDDCFADRWPVG